MMKATSRILRGHVSVIKYSICRNLGSLWKSFCSVLLIKAKESPYGKRNSQVIFLLNTQHHMVTYRKLATSSAMAIFCHMVLSYVLYNFFVFQRGHCLMGLKMNSLPLGRREDKQLHSATPLWNKAGNKSNLCVSKGLAAQSGFAKRHQGSVRNLLSGAGKPSRCMNSPGIGGEGGSKGGIHYQNQRTKQASRLLGRHAFEE